MGSNRDGCKPGGQETQNLWSGEDRVGKRVRPSVRYYEDGSSTIHMQERL